MHRYVVVGLIWILLMRLCVVADTMDLQTRSFSIKSPVSKLLSGSDGIQRFREYLESFHFRWPDGAAMTYDRASQILTVVNTPDNIDIIRYVDTINSADPGDINIQFEFIEYGIDVIEALARDDNLNADALLEAWRQGEGKLIYAPNLLSGFGQEVSVHGVAQVGYSSQRTPCTNCATDGGGTAELRAARYPRHMRHETSAWYCGLFRN